MANHLLVGLAASLVIVVCCHAQRPPYAGTRPIGYGELAERFRVNETTTISLVNRVGEDGRPITTQRTTTERLPVDALGQKELIDRIKMWPMDKWPFWYLNYLAIEEQRARPVAGPPLANGTRQAVTGGTPVNQTTTIATMVPGELMGSDQVQNK